METTTQGALTEAAKAPREKSISLTESQLKELNENADLLPLIIEQVKQSDGNLKGAMAFQVAKTILKQIKIWSKPPTTVNVEDLATTIKEKNELVNNNKKN